MWSTAGTLNQCFDSLTQVFETYEPLYAGSAVLPDGRLVMVGGEYNYALSNSEVWSNLGEIYDPVANSWTCQSAPSSWGKLGDAMSVVLPNGTFLLGNALGTQVATLNVSTNPTTWNVINPTGKSADDNGYNNEEGWTLLPNGNVLTLEIWNSADTTSTPALQYNASTQTWSSAGTAPDPLVLITLGSTNYHEIGPAILRPDGTVFATGATGFNDIYNSSTNTWSKGPSFPTIVENVICHQQTFANQTEQFAVVDGPAALLPTGNVLVDASVVDANCGYVNGVEFFEFDGTNLTQVGGTTSSSSTVSYEGRLLVLPNGQVLFDDGGGQDVEVYTPTGTYNPAWAPTITSAPIEVGVGATNMKITGTQFNGLSQAVAYGDDYQAATNYPLVRITNLATGDVFYARTHGHSTMGVATGNAAVSTWFDVPANIELGASSLVVVANGIPSTPVSINVLPPGSTTLSSSANPSTMGASVAFTATVSGTGGTPTGTVTLYDGTTSVATSLGTVALTGGTAILNTFSLALGGHSITAQYNGDANFGPTTSTAILQVVNGQAATVTLASAQNPAPVKSAVTFTATVSPTGGGTPTGTVTFLDANSSGDGNTALGTVALSGGTAVLSTSSSASPFMIAGYHSITAQYSGDTTFSPSTSVPVVEVVDNPVPGITSLSPSISAMGGTAFKLTVNGTNFLSTSVVDFNDSAQTTMYVSPTQLLAAITTTDIAMAGSYPVTVTNPGPGGGPSNSVNFTVNPVSGTPAYLFVPLTPCRVADTRNPTGPFGGPALASQSIRSFTIPSSACGIPSTATAYSLNVTVVPSGSLGYISMWPTGQPQPVVSTLNSLDGRIKSDAAMVPAGAGGAVSVFATDATNVILDVNGYFVPTTVSTAMAFYPVTPCRVADTRNAAGALGGPSLMGGQIRSFPVLSACGIPSIAQAYSLNFTVVPQGPLGYLTLWPVGQAQPLVSTLNAPTGTLTANAAIVPAGTGGKINLYATDNSDVIIDINGYFAPPASGSLSLYPLTPCRVLDTRQAAGAFAGTLNVNVTGSGCGTPVTAQSYVFNATVIPSITLGYLTLWPQGAAQPVVSTLNDLDGTLTSNMAIVPTDNGSVSAYATDPTQLILDISGYFAP
jgi:hypothetical protein